MATVQKKILIVDDEKALVGLVALHMRTAGYNVLIAHDGWAAIDACRRHKPDLVILDLMLPKLNGWEVCRRIREDDSIRDTAVLMLSARGEIDDKLRGFDAGADDYVTKPFSPRELVARVKRILERSDSGKEKETRFAADGLEIDLVDFRVKARDREVPLTEKERAVLKVLLDHRGKLLSHERILHEAWGGNALIESGNVDVHISHLREKIEKDPQNPRFIKTVKGEGYRFDA
jgi:two-component system alkaline phosphatase synthesis response regulator PhoP